MIDSGVLLISRATVRLKSCETSQDGVTEQFLNTCWGKKSGPCFFVLVIYRGSITISMSLTMSLFIGDTSAADLERWGVP
jgi:hypothetical protein